MFHDKLRVRLILILKIFLIFIAFENFYFLDI